MSAKDLLRFLVGDRAAILRIAQCRSALWLALAFVMLAALAREYDQEYLVVAPWYLVIPPAASFLVASMLYLVLRGTLGWRGVDGDPPQNDAFRQFVALFWMTAPLAWCYAIPYERFLSEVDATVANLWSLCLVSVWRVLLITRVISVLFTATVASTFVAVLLVCAVVALLAIQALPFPIIVVMGGVNPDAAEQAVRGAAVFVGGMSLVAIPVCLLALFARALRRPGVPYLSLPRPVDSNCHVAKGAWRIAWIGFGVAIVPLVMAQREQRISYQQNEQLVAVREAEKTEYMFRELERLHARGEGSDAREEIAVIFAEWLSRDGARFYREESEDQVQRMLLLVCQYRDARGRAGAFVSYLQRYGQTARTDIDLALIESALRPSGH